MALHYIISSEKTACGRTATSTNATSNTTDVTCKTCCKSEAYVSAFTPVATAPSVTTPPTGSVSIAEPEPAAETAPATTSLASPKPPTRGGRVAFEEWRSRLNSNDRLPRGRFAGQRESHDPAQSRSAA